MAIFANDEARRSVFEGLQALRRSIKGVETGSECNVVTLAAKFAIGVGLRSPDISNPVSVLEVILDHAIAADLRVIVLDSMLEDTRKQAMLSMRVVPE